MTPHQALWHGNSGAGVRTKDRISHTSRFGISIRFFTILSQSATGFSCTRNSHHKMQRSGNIFLYCILSFLLNFIQILQIFFALYFDIQPMRRRDCIIKNAKRLSIMQKLQVIEQNVKHLKQQLEMQIQIQLELDLKIQIHNTSELQIQDT